MLKQTTWHQFGSPRNKSENINICQDLQEIYERLNLSKIYEMSGKFEIIHVVNLVIDSQLSAHAGKNRYAEPKGGDWGNREEEINELIRRMN